MKELRISCGTLVIKLVGEEKLEVIAALGSLSLEKILIETDAPKLPTSETMNIPWNVLKSRLTAMPYGVF